MGLGHDATVSFVTATVILTGQVNCRAIIVADPQVAIPDISLDAQVVCQSSEASHCTMSSGLLKSRQTVSTGIAIFVSTVIFIV